MKKTITILLFVFILSLSNFAQDTEAKDERKCPDISITGPPSIADPGKVQIFTLTISGGNVDKDKIKIKWEIDKGIIVEGQGTKHLVVKIDTDETITVTANVDAGGECQLSESESGIIGDPSMSTLIDEFGNLNSGDIKARLDAFMVDLQNNPGDEGYIINYGSSSDVSKRERFIRNQLNFRNFDMPRITFVNGGIEKKIRTRLWRVPPGADVSQID